MHVDHALLSELTADDARLDALEATDTATDARLDAVEADAAEQIERNPLNVLNEGVTGTVGGTGTGDQSAALQAANNKARAQGRMLYLPPLVYRTTSQVTFDVPMDATGATIYWAGGATVNGAVRVAPVDGVTPLLRVNMILPKIVQGTRTWGGNDVGLLIGAIFACHITVPLIQDFSVGMDLAGLNIGVANGGVAYCTFYIGSLANNQVNQRLKPCAANGPHANQNTFIGGQYSHFSGGVSAGTKHIQLAMPGLAANGWSQPNNNVWLNPSLEGFVVEYDIDCDGASNVWLCSRHEGDGTPGDHKARFSGLDPARRAMRNVIWTGYEGPNLAIEEGSNAVGNSVLSFGDFVRLAGGSADGTLALSNYGSNTAASLLIAPFANFHTDDLSTTYTVSISATAIKLKATGSANPLVQIDPGTGLISLGNGTAVADITLQRVVVDGIATVSSNAPLHLNNPGLRGYLSGVEQSSDPGAPAANGFKLYAKDVGGKTALFVRFNTGAVQQIAIEP